VVCAVKTSSLQLFNMATANSRYAYDSGMVAFLPQVFRGQIRIRCVLCRSAVVMPVVMLLSGLSADAAIFRGSAATAAAAAACLYRPQRAGTAVYALGHPDNQQALRVSH
jgi:hypothetical protein